MFNYFHVQNYIIFFFDASMPTTLAPSLHIGSDNNPPPQPISSNLIFFNGLSDDLILKSLIIFSFIYLILIGLKLCNGLNLPLGSHHSSAILENFSISFLFIEFIIDNLWT